MRDGKTGMGKRDAPEKTIGIVYPDFAAVSIRQRRFLRKKRVPRQTRTRHVFRSGCRDEVPCPPKAENSFLIVPIKVDGLRFVDMGRMNHAALLPILFFKKVLSHGIFAQDIAIIALVTYGLKSRSPGERERERPRKRPPERFYASRGENSPTAKIYRKSLILLVL